MSGNVPINIHPVVMGRHIIMAATVCPFIMFAMEGFSAVTGLMNLSVITK